MEAKRGGLGYQKKRRKGCGSRPAGVPACLDKRSFCPDFAVKLSAYPEGLLYAKLEVQGSAVAWHPVTESARACSYYSS